MATNQYTTDPWKILTSDMAIDNTMWIHTFMTQLCHIHKKYTVELRYEKSIATNQYKLELCDNIYIIEISNMVVILESFTYSSDLHHIFGKAHKILSSQPRVFIMILKWYDSSHVNKWLDVEHGRDHLIIGH